MLCDILWCDSGLWLKGRLTCWRNNAWEDSNLKKYINIIAFVGQFKKRLKIKIYPSTVQNTLEGGCRLYENNRYPVVWFRLPSRCFNRLTAPKKLQLNRIKIIITSLSVQNQQMMLDGAVKLPLSFPAVNKKTNEDEVASRAKSKSLITKASKIVHFSTLWCFLEQVCNGGINKNNNAETWN